MTRALRVLHIASGDLWAGAEVQAFTLMTHLMRMPNTAVAAVLMNEGTLAERLRAAGIGVFVTDERQAGALRILMGLRRVLLEWQPDVLHSHRAKENILACIANRSCRNVPAVRTVHGANEHAAAAGLRGLRHRLINDADRWCGQVLQQKVIAVTQELGSRLSREFSPEKIVVIENGVDVQAVRANQGIAEFRVAAPEATHIGIAGRLVQVKRVDLFLEAAALLRQRYPQRHWKFHVLGDGPLRRELERRAGQLALADSVVFHGHRQDIATCIAGLDGLVICSDHEGMPMVALEAAALGVPTVAHAVGGLVEVVPQEFLVTLHDASGYSAGILRAIATDGRSIAMKHAAERLTVFSAEHNAERIRALYEQVLAESHGGNRKAKEEGLD